MLTSMWQRGEEERVDPDEELPKTKAPKAQPAQEEEDSSSSSEGESEVPSGQVVIQHFPPGMTDQDKWDLQNKRFTGSRAAEALLDDIGPQVRRVLTIPTCSQLTCLSL